MTPLVDPLRTNPLQAVGAPQGDNTFNFVSLGFGGSITLGFTGGSAINGPGADLLVRETTFGNNTFATYPESAEVFVSQDGVNFFSVGFAETNEDALFDIDDAGQGFTSIIAVRVVDTTPLTSISDDGYDLDGIESLNGCMIEELEGARAASSTDGVATVGSVLASYPNPTEGVSNIVFSTVETGRTTIAVYDMNGRNVATLFNQEADAGQEYRLNFDGAALPNGVYVYRLTNANETIIEKFMIAR